MQFDIVDLLQVNVQGSVTSFCVFFSMKLKLGDAALRIEVNIDAVSPASSPAAHVYSCLQQHITKLQVKWLHTARLSCRLNCITLLCLG